MQHTSAARECVALFEQGFSVYAPGTDTRLIALYHRTACDDIVLFELGMQYLCSGEHHATTVLLRGVLHNLLRFMQNTPSKSGKQEHALLGDECPLVFFGFEYSL